jgi:hypothetical protein
VGQRAFGGMAAAALALGLLAAMATDAYAAGNAASSPSRPYALSEQREPCAAYHPLRHPFFGDTHVHTAFSQDASTQGTRNGPRDAYRFARGGRMGIQPYDSEGRPQRWVQLERPLDFAAVTDHAEQLGEVHICNTPEAQGYDAWVCRIYRRWPRFAFFLMNTRTTWLESRWGFCGAGGVLCLEAAHGVWQEIQAAAEAAYDRSAACRFTSFVAYEWTAGADAGRNLHRNVIFRNHLVPDMPVSFLEARTAIALWDHLQTDCVEAGAGCDALTIPHNSNLSGGLMFESAGEPGTPIEAAEAARRVRWEPLVEMMQHKGDSECAIHAVDEFCGFEKLPYDSFGGKFFPRLLGPAEFAPANFAREALKSGLALGDELGANPFKFGLVASTDTHLGAAGLTDPREYPGHGGAGAPAGDRMPVGLPDDVEFAPGGLAVLWAEENARDALFDAMRRREAYGTSGTRPIVRFFGGWRYPEDLCERAAFVEIGYREGVPMGGELPPSTAEAPVFAMLALQDPGTESLPGTPLQRIQIVKGWLDADGQTHERVVDVAGGENEARVDLATCRQEGPGESTLCAVWRDPDFDPAQRAFFYARVLENPSCRWSQYACNAHGVDCADPATIGSGLEPCCAPDHQGAVQQRAWTSAIWYEP